MTTVKITELTDIGANLATSTVVPVVNMAGTPTTQKTNIGNIANIILEGAGVDYPEASVALLAQTVSNAAQPNITSVGTLTNVAVSGNASVNGNLTSNGTAYLGNISTTGSATITTLVVGTSANLGAVANVKITGGTAGQVLSTDGAGNLSWASDATTYGNSNVAAYLPTYTGNIGANVVTANLFTGNGSSLSAIAGANVSGFVPNANVANTAFAVAAANVSGLGNIATINLTGSTSNVLYGNGVFAAVAGGANTGNVTFDDNIVIGTGDEYGGDGLFLATGPNGAANLQYLRLRGGDFPTHIHLDTGNNAFYDQYFGNDNKFVKLEAGDAGNVVIGTDDTTGNLYNWTFTSDGNFILANGNSVIKSIANSSLDPVNPNVSTMVLTPDPGYSTQSLVLDPTAPGHIHLRAPGANIDEPSANIFLGGEDSSFEVGYYNGAAPNVFIHSNTNTWTFENTGNLNLPAGGNLNFNLGGITQTINQELNIVVQDEEDDGWSIFNTITDGLGNSLSQTQLDSTSFTIAMTPSGTTHSWGFDGNTLQVVTNSTISGFASNVVLQSMVSGGGGTASLQSVSGVNDPNIFSAFDATTTGANIVVYNGGSNGGVGYTWQFANDGKLTFPGTPRIDTATNNFEVQAAENINFEANAVVNIYTDAGNNAYQWQFGDDGNLIVPGNTAISTSNATGGNAGNSITIKAGAADQSDYYTTAGGNLNLVGGLGATDDGGGGGPGGDVNIASGLSADPAGHAGNINITAGSNDWIFDYNGDLTLPGNLVYIGASPAPSISGFNSVSAEQFTNDTSNVTINANSNLWNFDSTGNLTLPGNISGNTNGYTIGYLNIPQVAASNTTIALSDAGKHYYSTTAGNLTLTIPNNATTSFATGTAISIVVQAAGNILVNAAGGVTLYMAGNSTAANRVVGGYGMATLMKVGTDTWFINGTGVS